MTFREFCVNVLGVELTPWQEMIAKQLVKYPPPARQTYCGYGVDFRLVETEHEYRCRTGYDIIEQRTIVRTIGTLRDKGKES